MIDGMRRTATSLLIIVLLSLTVFILPPATDTIGKEHCRRNNPSDIDLPVSAEKLILKKMEAKRVVDIHELVFQKTQHADYLAVSITLEIEWGFESWYHTSIIMEKPHEESDWRNAQLYRTSLDLMDLFNRPYAEFKNSLEPYEVNLSSVEKEKKVMGNEILGIMNTVDILQDSRGGMPTGYEYSFLDECRFKVHSEWYGQTHAVIDDEVIPLREVKISKLEEERKYYLFFKCSGAEKCIHVKGENTGDHHNYMSVQSIVPGGSSEEVFVLLKRNFERLIFLCTE